MCENSRQISREPTPDPVRNTASGSSSARLNCAISPSAESSCATQARNCANAAPHI